MGEGVVVPQEYSLTLRFQRPLQISPLTQRE